MMILIKLIVIKNFLLNLNLETVLYTVKLKI